MKALQECFDQNRAWSARMRERDPGFFERLVRAQRPQLLWIGCSDSRLPPDQVVGRLPGEIFVHRNVGNVVVHTDLNCLSVLQYGIEVLGVKHVIVCGHYGCGGVKAAMSRRDFGLIDRWLQNIKDCAERHQTELSGLPDEEARSRRLVELNVIEQVDHLAKTSVIQRAWKKEGRPWLHGWVYEMRSGRLEELVRRTSTDLPHPVHRYDLDEP